MTPHKRGTGTGTRPTVSGPTWPSHRSHCLSRTHCMTATAVFCFCLSLTSLWYDLGSFTSSLTHPLTQSFSFITYPTHSQTLWQRLYVRDGLGSTLAPPSHAAKARLRQRNTELMEQLEAVKAQLTTLRTAAQCQLDRQGSVELDKTDVTVGLSRAMS